MLKLLSEVGGHAFPSDANNGMTLRDWFAGQSLAGILASGSRQADEEIAMEAYTLADAMLEARKE